MSVARIIVIVLSVLFFLSCGGRGPELPQGFDPGEPVTIDWARSTINNTPIYWAAVYSSNASGNFGNWITSTWQEESVLEQTATGKTGNIAFITYNSIQDFSDFTASIDLLTLDDPAGQGGGILWALKSTNDYYACYINYKVGRTSIIRIKNGGESVIMEKKIKPRKKGGRLNCTVVSATGVTTLYVDNKKLMSVKQQDVRSGKVGVYTKNGVRTIISNIIITPLVKQTL